MLMFPKVSFRTSWKTLIRMFGKQRTGRQVRYKPKLKLLWYYYDEKNLNERYNNQTDSFRKKCKEKSTELSKYV